MLEGLINNAIKVGCMVSLINEHKKDREKEKMREVKRKYKKTSYLDSDEFDEDELEELRAEEEELRREEEEERRELEAERREEARLKREEAIQKREDIIAKNSNTILSINERMYKPIPIVALIIICALCYAYLLRGDSISATFIFFVLVILGCVGFLIWKLYEKITYTKYIEQIIIHNERDINSIAKRLNVSVEKVIDDVSYLAIRGYIARCFVDKKRNKIIINGKKSSVSENANLIKPAKIRCEGCGAINSFDYDVKHICKYCGRALD